MTKYREDLRALVERVLDGRGIVAPDAPIDSEDALAVAEAADRAATLRERERYEAKWYLLANDCGFCFWNPDDIKDHHGFVSFEADKRSHKIALNFNDTFGYAEAYCEDVNEDECVEVARVHQELGWYGIVAWAAKRSGMAPIAPIAEHDEYKRAAAAIRQGEK